MTKILPYGTCRSGNRTLVVLPGDEADGDELYLLTLARNRRLRILIIERVSKESGRQLLADIIGEVERKRVRVMSQSLIDVPQHLSVDRIQINRNAGYYVASAIKIAEHMSTRERDRSGCH